MAQRSSRTHTAAHRAPTRPHTARAKQAPQPPSPSVSQPLPGINARGRLFFKQYVPTYALYIIMGVVYFNVRNPILLWTTLILAAYAILVAGWYGLVRREIPTLFPAPDQPYQMRYGSRAIIQSALATLIVVAFLPYFLDVFHAF